MSNLKEVDGLYIWVLGTKTGSGESLVSNYEDRDFYTNKLLAHTICGDRNRDSYDIWLENLPAEQEIYPNNLYPWLSAEEQTPEMLAKSLDNSDFTGPWYVKQYVFVGPA